MQMCEKCEVAHARWHQQKPVERFLCSDCAVKDQANSKYWHGTYDSDGFRPLAA